MMLSSLDLPDNVDDALPHCFHLVRDPMFLTQCVDKRGHQVVVVARHRREQTSKMKRDRWETIRHNSIQQVNSWGLNYCSVHCNEDLQ